MDGSENSKRASDGAIDLAAKYGAELLVLHVMPRLTYESIPVSLTMPAIPPTGYGRLYEEAKAEAARWVKDVVGRAEARGVKARSEVSENAPSIVEAITNQANQEKADLIVVGTTGKSGFKKLLIGSVSSGVVTHAKQPVLVVR